ncbi:MAG: peptidyl-prolyl cis-trans isomerase [Rhodocyclaceae bacterium]
MHQSLIKQFVFAALSTLSLAAGAQAQTFSVNGAAVPALRAQIALQQALGQGVADTPQVREAVRNNLINGELVVQAAHKDGLDRLPEVEERMALAARSVLIAAYQENFVRTHPVTDAEVATEYNTLRGRLGENEYDVSHMLFASEADARVAIARLNKGESFDAVVAQASIDAGSRDRGGALGWNPLSAYEAPFAAAVKTLAKGRYTTEPVHTSFGWHVIRVNDARALALPPLEQATPRIREVLARRKFDAYLAELRRTARIEMISAGAR